MARINCKNQRKLPTAILKTILGIHNLLFFNLYYKTYILAKQWPDIDHPPFNSNCSFQVLVFDSAKVTFIK